MHDPSILITAWLGMDDPPIVIAVELAIVVLGLVIVLTLIRVFIAAGRHQPYHRELLDATRELGNQQRRVIDAMRELGNQQRRVADALVKLLSRKHDKSPPDE